MCSLNIQEEIIRVFCAGLTLDFNRAFSCEEIKNPTLHALNLYKSSSVGFLSCYALLFFSLFSLASLTFLWETGKMALFFTLTESWKILNSMSQHESLSVIIRKLKAASHCRRSQSPSLSRSRKQSRKSAYDVVKTKNRSRKRSHKRDGIGVKRIRTFSFLPTSLMTPSLTFRLWSSENQIVGVGSRNGRINQSQCTLPRLEIGTLFSLDHIKGLRSSTLLITTPTEWKPALT